MADCGDPSCCDQIPTPPGGWPESAFESKPRVLEPFKTPMADALSRQMVEIKLPTGEVVKRG